MVVILNQNFISQVVIQKVIVTENSSPAELICCNVVSDCAIERRSSSAEFSIYLNSSSVIKFKWLYSKAGISSPRPVGTFSPLRRRKICHQEVNRYNRYRSIHSSVLQQNTQLTVSLFNLQPRYTIRCEFKTC